MQMEKTMLTDARMRKGFSQQQLADVLCIDVSTYSRKEKGVVKIRHEEWGKLAKALGVNVEEIYEPDESRYFVCKDNATGNYQGTNNIYTIPEHFIEMQRKYIEKLEQEIERLKQNR
jgi:transcriptional regulator with XRE-family HTH domain